jgi:hypothetical protein
MGKLTRIVSLPGAGFSNDNGSSETAFLFAFRHGIDMYQIITFLADTRRQVTVASRTAMLGLFIHLVYLFFRMNISSLFFLFFVKYISSPHAFLATVLCLNVVAT